MNPIAFAVPVFLLLILLELWVAHSRGVSVYRLKDSLTSINVGIMSEFSKAIGGLISVIMFTLISDRFGAYTWDVSNPMTWISAFYYTTFAITGCIALATKSTFYGPLTWCITAVKNSISQLPCGSLLLVSCSVGFSTFLWLCWDTQSRYLWWWV